MTLDYFGLCYTRPGQGTELFSVLAGELGPEKPQGAKETPGRKPLGQGPIPGLGDYWTDCESCLRRAAETFQLRSTWIGSG